MGQDDLGQAKVTELDRVSFSQKDCITVSVLLQRAVTCLLLTILRLEIAVQDHLVRLLALEREGILGQADCVAVDLWWLLAVMAAVQGADELGKDGPNELFVGQFVASLEVLDHDTKIAIAAVFHVKMQVVGCFEMFSLIVGDDVGVAEAAQDLELGLQLLALLL